MKNNEPLGNPKYSKGIQAVECGLSVVVECDSNLCGIINIIENGEICKRFHAGTLSICKKNDDSDCDEAGKDYRGAKPNEPYVNLKGLEMACGLNFIPTGNYSIFPKKGQSLDDLYNDIAQVICECLNPSKFPEKIMTTNLYSLFFYTYKGGPLNGNPLTWTDPQFLWDGVNDVQAYRAKLRSFRVNGIELTEYPASPVVSPEWDFANDFIFEESLWDGLLKNQNISDWLNDFDFVKNNDVIVKDNGGVIIHNAGDVIDFVIYPERKINGVWSNWPSRAYGISTELGNGYASQAHLNILGFQALTQLDNQAPFSQQYNP